MTARAVAPLRPHDRVVVVGAGPAGLTAAYLLARDGHDVTVLEADDCVGGISRTVVHRGFRFDIGGHRFFTKISAVEALWREWLAHDLISVPRLSRIYYGGRFFDYPIKPANVLARLGPVEATRIVASYLKWHSFGFGLSQLLFLYIVLKCIRSGEKAPEKPWEGADSLEWTHLPTPVPYHTFDPQPDLR